jgi:hypothetical protein
MQMSDDMVVTAISDASEQKPAPQRHVPVSVPDQARLEKMLRDPLTSSGELATEAERMERVAAELRARERAKQAKEKAEREREAEKQRQVDASAAELRKVLDAGMAEVHKAFPPELVTLAEEVHRARMAHHEKVAPLGINSAVADRVLWAHPIWPLLPWLDLLRKDGEPRWQKDQ